MENYFVMVNFLVLDSQIYQWDNDKTSFISSSSICQFVDGMFVVCKEGKWIV